MKIIYQAEDGTTFDNEFDCLAYEETKTYNFIYSIDFFDSFGDKYSIVKENLFNDNWYYSCEKIHIHNQDELSELLRLSRDCGWCEFYEQIDSVGVWERKEIPNSFQGKWIKVITV